MYCALSTVKSLFPTPCTGKSPLPVLANQVGRGVPTAPSDPHVGTAGCALTFARLAVAGLDWLMAETVPALPAPINTTTKRRV